VVGGMRVPPPVLPNDFGPPKAENITPSRNLYHLEPHNAATIKALNFFPPVAGKNHSTLSKKCISTETAYKRTQKKKQYGPTAIGP